MQRETWKEGGVIEKYKGAWVEFDLGENLSVSELNILSHLVCRQHCKLIKPSSFFSTERNSPREVHQSSDLPKLCLTCSCPHLMLFLTLGHTGLPPSGMLSSPLLIWLTAICSWGQLWVPSGLLGLWAALYFIFQSMYCLLLCVSCGQPEGRNYASFILVASRNRPILGTQAYSLNQ